MTLSFIIPVYNFADKIGGTVKAILAEIAESGLTSEVVVVDDGSTDGSGDVARAFGQQVRVLRQKNQGVSVARNRGLAEARGDFVWFVDADDGIVPGALVALKPLLEAGGFDVLSFGFTAKQADKPLRLGRVLKYDMDQKSESQRVLRRLGGVLWAWNGVFKRSVISNLSFKPYPNGEDTLWGYEALLKARTVWRTETPLYVYRDNGEGASRKLTMRHLDSLLSVGNELAILLMSCRHADWFASQCFRHLSGITHNGAARVVRALGSAGYKRWCEGSRRIYLDSGLLKGVRRFCYGVLLTLSWPCLIECCCFRPIEWKGAFVRFRNKLRIK